MKQLDITIQNPTGLHARPAKIFVNTAKQFKSDIRVQHREKKANAKSLISMLTLGVETGSEIRILVNGADEDEAIGALETAVLSGLGESEHIAVSSQQSAVSGQRSAVSGQQSADGSQQSAVSSQQSAVSSQQSAANGQRPATSDQQPATSNQRPATSNQQPATSNQQPATSNQQPATSNQQPATSNQQPATSNQQPATNNQLKGIAAAPGIAIGPVYQFKQAELEVTETFAGSSEEQTQLQEAIERARSQLGVLRKQMLKRDASAEADIFDVHLEILDDPDLLDAVLEKINAKQNAAQAWQATIDARAKLVAGLDDPLLAARSADLHDVGYRVLRLLVGAFDQGHKLPDHPVIVLAHDLSPSDTASLDKDRVLGFCTAVGGPTAHSAIIARALSLPAIVSAGEKALEIEDGTVVIVNGSNGLLTIGPDETAVSHAQKAQQQWQAQRDAANKSAAEPAITQDGHRVEIAANIGGLADAEEAMRSGAEGVGLLRTEFLFLERTDPPTEDEQFAVYRDVRQAMQGQPVIIRTLDIGGDKPLPYIEVPPEENPFLGERGIRLCLNRPELLREQVRAILRAAKFGKLRIMFPMVADVSEWRAARAIVEEIRAELNAPPVELGIMIEVPSAALMADAFAPEVDFFSVGTNDLTQYTLAMDRMHPSLAGKSDGLHPAVLRLIGRTVEAAHAAGKWTGVCGELGADPQAIPILIGLGVDELSVSVPAIPTVKSQVRSLNLNEAKTLAQKALSCATAQEVRALTT